jgi:hypothetical protein
MTGLGSVPASAIEEHGTHAGCDDFRAEQNTVVDKEESHLRHVHVRVGRQAEARGQFRRPEFGAASRLDRIAAGASRAMLDR